MWEFINLIISLRWGDADRTISLFALFTRQGKKPSSRRSRS